MTEAAPFIQAWLIASVVTFGLLTFTPWRQRTRLLAAVLAPLLLIVWIAWFFLRTYGGGAGRGD